MLAVGDMVIYSRSGRFHTRMTGEIGIIRRVQSPDGLHKEWYKIDWDNPEIFRGVLAVSRRNISLFNRTPNWEV